MRDKRADSYRERAIADELLRLGNGTATTRTFKFAQLSAATKNFRTESLLGEGGFGRVYKGRLEKSNQVSYSAKLLSRLFFVFI